MEDTIMKKTYINPEVAVVKIASKSQILAGSNGTLSTDDSDRITTSDGFGAREFDFDDDEY